MKLSLQKSHAFAAAIAGFALAVTPIASALGWRELPTPFVWLDVAAVYFLSALPLAASVVTAALLQLPLRRSTLAILTLEAVILVFIPRLYIHARCRRDLNEAVLLTRDSRYGEASALIHRVLALEPHAEWNGNSAALAAKNIDEIVARVEDQIAQPLPTNANDEQRVERAERLAILGKTRDALVLLDASPTLSDLPAACNLRGTIHETRGQWQIALQWYAHAKAGWQSQPDSPARLAGLHQSTQGIAFCERKLGRLHAAEAAWQELLAISPTADIHLLLAQFYEDTQQTAQAQYHAQQALQLAPENNVIQLQARQLQSKLLTSHFGCVGIVSEQWVRPRIPLPLGKGGERSSPGEGLTK